MKKYLNGLANILKKGFLKKSRTGTDIISTFGELKRYDLSDYQLPAVTTKKLFFKSFIHETLWFISGSVMLGYLKQHGISIWDSWVDKATAVWGDYKDYEQLDKEIRQKMGWEDKPFSFVTTGVNSGTPGMPYSVKEEKNEVVISVRPVAWELITSDPSDDQKALHEHFIRWQAGQCDVNVKHLLDGSIGEGAYGSMWRNITDIRKISEGEDRIKKHEDFEKKGFEFIGETRHGDDFYERKIDQLQNAINLLRTNPDSRRILVCAFDPRMVDFCELPPCHSFFQLWSRELTVQERITWMQKHDTDLFKDIDQFVFSSLPEEARKLALIEWMTRHGVPVRALSLLIYLRSNDAPVGEPFNTAQYGLLAHMIAHVTGHVAEELVYVNGDHHIYVNQVELVNVQLEREPIEQVTTVKLNKDVKEIDDFKFEDIEIKGYNVCHPRIDYPVAV